jgi:hypothetical protein
LKRIVYILIFLAIVLFSCERIKNKGQEIATKTERKVKSKSKDLYDKISPQFDYDKADTKYNKKRFAEYLEIELTPDITNIYCYGDFLGADYKVLFSFSCDFSTVQKIIKQQGMALTSDSNDDGLWFLDKFKWWDKDKIKELRAYKVGKEYEYWHYLWYDKDNKKAYYEEFSL